MGTDSNPPNQIAYPVFHALFPLISPRSSHGFLFTNSQSVILSQSSCGNSGPLFGQCVFGSQVIRRALMKDRGKSTPSSVPASKSKDKIIAHVLRIKDHTEILWPPRSFIGLFLWLAELEIYRNLQVLSYVQTILKLESSSPVIWLLIHKRGLSCILETDD